MHVKAFGEQFLEPLSRDGIPVDAVWSWTPAGEDIKAIYASGGNTTSRSSTYANEKDDRSDDDRPNEGRFH